MQKHTDAAACLLATDTLGMLSSSAAKSFFAAAAADLNIIPHWPFCKRRRHHGAVAGGTNFHN